MRLLYWIVLVPLALIVGSLAVANRQIVQISLDPLPFAYDAPLYLVVLAALLAGLLLGVAAAWAGGHKWRRLARRRGRDLADAEAEVRRLRAQAATPATPPPAATRLPAPRADAA